jgi:hypothetical protein
MYFGKFKKRKTYPTGLGRARGPNPPRPSMAAEAHWPAVAMADTPPPATPSWRARQGTRAPYKACHQTPCAPHASPHLAPRDEARASPRAPPELTGWPTSAAASQDSGRIPSPPTAVSSSPQPSRAPLPISHRGRTPRSSERRWFGRTGRRPLPVHSWTEEEEALGNFAFRPLEYPVIFVFSF